MKGILDQYKQCLEMHRDSNQRYATIVTPVVTYGSLKTRTKPIRDELKEPTLVCLGKRGTSDPPGNFHPPPPPTLSE